MRYKITVSGTLETWADEATVRRDFGLFVADIETVHSGIESGSVTLDSVEALPEPIPEPIPEPTPEPTSEVDTHRVLALLESLSTRLDKAGL